LPSLLPRRYCQLHLLLPAILMTSPQLLLLLLLLQALHPTSSKHSQAPYPANPN
jgi:hypothetical protein